MDAFKWDHNFATGLGSVDRQHQQLINLVNELGDGLLNGRAQQDCYRHTLQALLDYAESHFREEEELMVEVGLDPRHLEEHIKQHQSFFLHVGALISANQQPEAPRALLDFLCNWLTYHILGIDQNMARQISAVRSGLPSAEAYDAERNHYDGQTGPLLSALSALFDLLVERNQELTRANEVLEAKVAARVKDLDRTNRQLKALAMTDPLTGIANRRSGVHHLEQTWQEQVKKPLSCLLIDADDFKSVNDRHGHEAGDMVLKQLANAISHELRTDDHLCRLGGDEFLVICPDTDQFGALHLAEKIRLALSGLSIPFETGRWSASISVGVAQRNDTMENFEHLIRLADRGVYAAKAAGRNHVMAA